MLSSNIHHEKTLRTHSLQSSNPIGCLTRSPDVIHSYDFAVYDAHAFFPTTLPVWTSHLWHAIQPRPQSLLRAIRDEVASFVMPGRTRAFVSDTPRKIIKNNFVIGNIPEPFISSITSYQSSIMSLYILEFNDLKIWSGNFFTAEDAQKRGILTIARAAVSCFNHRVNIFYLFAASERLLPALSNDATLCSIILGIKVEISVESLLSFSGERHFSASGASSPPKHTIFSTIQIYAITSYLTSALTSMTQ